MLQAFPYAASSTLSTRMSHSAAEILSLCVVIVRGKFKAEIYLDRVPLTASNFIDLALSGFYEGIHFHRVPFYYQ